MTVLINRFSVLIPLTVIVTKIKANIILLNLIEEVDVVYVTICMDVFNASIAPGVSALAYNGIFADATFMTFFRHILKQPKLVALDVAEVNPEFDIQNRAARLAASLVNEWFMI